MSDTAMLPAGRTLSCRDLPRCSSQECKVFTRAGVHTSALPASHESCSFPLTLQLCPAVGAVLELMNAKFDTMMGKLVASSYPPFP